MVSNRIVDDISREETVAARRARTSLLMPGAQASPFQVLFGRIRHLLTITAKVAEGLPPHGRGTEGTRDTPSLCTSNAKRAPNLGVRKPFSHGDDRMGLLQAVKDLSASCHMFNRTPSGVRGGSRRVNSFCHVIKYSAEGDQTARPEMASGLSGSSSLLSLMRAVVSQVAVSVWQRRGLTGETRDVLSLRIRGAKLAVHLGVGLPRSTGSDSLAHVQLLQALCVRFLASSFQTFSQYVSRGSRMSFLCEKVVALAQGVRTARPEMASGLSRSSALLSLMRVVVSQVAVSVWQHRGLKGETRDVLSLRIRGATFAVHLGVGLPRSTGSESLARVQLSQALCVRFLASSFQTFSQYVSRGSRMSFKRW